MIPDDVEDESLGASVTLTISQWGEVCAALQGYVLACRHEEHVSRADAARALQEIDRVITGRDEVAPLDDLLSIGEGGIE